jgi:hypothetical protein
MDDTTAKWYYALEHEYGLVSWACFVDFINLNFGPPLHSNPLGELKDLRCTRTVEEYQRRFLALLCHCDGLSVGHVMNLFTFGLGEPMTSDIEMQWPVDLQATMSLAHAFECHVSVAPSAPTYRYPPRSRQMPVGAIAQASTVANSTTPAPATSVSAYSPAATTCSRFRRLSSEEMADKRKKGEC